LTADQPAPLPEPIALRPPSGARLLAAVLSILCFAYGPVEAQTVGPAYPTPPSIAYGELYRDVELASIFPDSKTFPAIRTPPSKIPDEYRAAGVARLRPRHLCPKASGRHPRARP
jgi:hypothetical protein